MASTEERLAFQKFVGTLNPLARKTAEDYPGLTCYKDFIGSHFWIQRYNDDGTVWLLHGRDSTLPGLDVQTYQPSELKTCDCGKWMPATQQQMRNSRMILGTVIATSVKN